MEESASLCYALNDPVNMIDHAAHLHDRKQIYQILDQVEQLIKNPPHPITLQNKAKIAKKAYEIEKNYTNTHSFWSRLLESFVTKFLHIHTDYDVIDGLHHIETDLDKNHLFIEAVCEGDPVAIQAFLDAGISPNDVTDNGESALLIAAQHGKIEAMKTLLNAGADIDFTHEGNLTTLMEMVKKPSTALNRAVIEYLVAHGANMDIQDKEFGYTALHWSIAAGQMEHLQILLQDGADPNIASLEKLPPLLEATQRNLLAAIPLLLQYKAHVNAQHPNGNTALHDCAQPYNLQEMSYVKGKLEAIKILLDAGADPYIENKDKKIPLDICCEQDRNIYSGNEVSEIFFILLKMGTQEDNIKTENRKKFAQQCIDLEKSYTKIIEYKRILLYHTDWLNEIEKERDVDYLKIMFEDQSQAGFKPSINKSNLKKDVIIKIGDKDYTVNGILLELESGFISALKSTKESVKEYSTMHLYNHVPDFITNQQFEKVLNHIEGIEELKDREQINPTYFHLHPFSKTITHFAELWDSENNQPKDELADMDIVYGDNQKIKVHKSLIAALNHDYQIDFVVSVDAKTIKDFLKLLYIADVSHLQSEKDIIEIANLCNAFKIDKHMMTRLGTRYYELALPKMLIYPDPSVALSEKDKFVLKNLPVGKLQLNSFPGITPEQFQSLISLMSHEFIPLIECSQCFKLKLDDLKTFKNTFKTSYVQ